MQITSSETYKIESVELVSVGDYKRLRIRIRVDIPFNHTNGKTFKRSAVAMVSFPV